MNKQTIQYSYSLVHEKVITLCILLHILTSVFTEHHKQLQSVIMLFTRSSTAST